MNVQRLIEKYKKLEGVWNAEGAELARQIFLEDLKQLDEPQPVKVSEEEAKFLKTFNFSHDSDVTKALYYVSRTGFCYYLTDNFDIELKGLSEGFRDLENRKRLIRAILDGYEVEEEKRYTVVMKATKQPLYYNAGEKKLFFSLGGLATIFTQKQLEEAGFGWVLDCEGIEIEEVE
ncbi:DUF1642 domain-containing protein [Streptococcus mitis]|uniref:DUF1642 domain-containing protein n=1 Tax=Streptococcus mitis TaxID=28037 RepID=UPI001C1EF10B|nr:DUF1642 domain-containing protein [Streptococcus mitis]MBU6824979.1 DUF1642 domain-containing protein [Streptococcus mitis]